MRRTKTLPTNRRETKKGKSITFRCAGVLVSVCVRVCVQCAPIREIVQTSNNNRVVGTNGQAVCVVFFEYCAFEKMMHARSMHPNTEYRDNANRTKNRTGVLSKNKRWSKQAIIFHFDQSTWWQTNELVEWTDEEQVRTQRGVERVRVRQRWRIARVTARYLRHLNGKKYFTPKKYSFFSSFFFLLGLLISGVRRPLVLLVCIAHAMQSTRIHSLVAGCVRVAST